jgi:hypothetical protein
MSKNWNILICVMLESVKLKAKIGVTCKMHGENTKRKRNYYWKITYMVEEN